MLPNIVIAAATTTITTAAPTATTTTTTTATTTTGVPRARSGHIFDADSTLAKTLSTAWTDGPAAATRARALRQITKGDAEEIAE